MGGGGKSGKLQGAAEVKAKRTSERVMPGGQRSEWLEGAGRNDMKRTGKTGWAAPCGPP